MGRTGRHAHYTTGGPPRAWPLWVVLTALLLPLTDHVLSLPPVPSFHRPSQPGPDLPGRGEAPSEALQRALFRLCTVSARPARPGRAGFPPSLGRGLRPLCPFWAATQLLERGYLQPPPGALGTGQVFSGRGPQPSHPAVCILLKQRKRYQEAKSKENISFKGC